MLVPSLEILAPLRTAIVGNSTITPLLGTWDNNPAVHTRSPMPSDSGFPAIVIQQITRTDQDEINHHRPIVNADISVFGYQPDMVRVVDQIADLVFALFHRQRAITVTNYSLIDIRASGPYPIPSDDTTTGRGISLTIRLRSPS